MKALIIEDEMVAATRLEKMLVTIDPKIEVLAKIGSVSASVAWLQKHTADLLFLDIQLSDGLSFSIFDRVQPSIPIIFTTAYDQYAIKAFDLYSVAYLLKPIRKKELEKSLQKYQTMRFGLGVDYEVLMSALGHGAKAYQQRFLIRIGEQYQKVDSYDIAYCFAMSKDVYAISFENKLFPMDYSLDALESLLSPGQFFRINRQYLVNMDAIEGMIALSRSRIQLQLSPPPKDSMGPVVSISHASAFKEWMNS